MKTFWRWSLAALAASWFGLVPAQATGPDAVRFGNAIELGDIASARKWLAAGLAPDFLADRIGSGLMIAAWEGNIPMMQLFLDHGADINRVSPIGEQALQLAAWKGHRQAVRWLLEHGAAINRGAKQWSALHYAALAGHGEIVQLLLERGADVNARTPNDSTALMMTAREGHEDLARMLLAAGADPSPVNDWGDNALTWAMRYKHPQVAKIVAAPAAYAQAVEAAPESFGKPSRSEPAPPQLAELLRQMRIAQAQGLPTEDLRKAFLDAVARFRGDSTPVAVQEGKSAAGRVPRALVITAQRKDPARERVELVYEDRKPAAPQRAMPTEVVEILRQLQIARAKGQAADDLRRALFDAVGRLKEGDATAGDAAK